MRKEIEFFEHTCKLHGLKITHQRLEIFRILAEAKDHPSAEEVYMRVREKIPTISFDTVYRTLALFSRHGMLIKLNSAESRTRYDANVKPHCHIVCTECKKITDFEWPALDTVPLPRMLRNWGRIETHSLLLRGICDSCLKRRKKE